MAKEGAGRGQAQAATVGAHRHFGRPRCTTAEEAGRAGGPPPRHLMLCHCGRPGPASDERGTGREAGSNSVTVDTWCRNTLRDPSSDSAVSELRETGPVGDTVSHELTQLRLLASPIGTAGPCAAPGWSRADLLRPQLGGWE